MKVIALDASTKSTGIAIFNDKELIHYGGYLSLWFP